MEENKNFIVPNVNSDSKNKTAKSFPILQILYKNLLFMIIITLLIGALGTIYGAVKVKNVYTVSSSVLLKVKYMLDDDLTNPEESGEDGDSNDSNKNSSVSISNNALAKRTLPTIISAITTPEILSKAREIESGVNGGSIGTSYGDESLIFKISYTDVSKELAQKKLKAVIQSMEELKVKNFPSVVELEFVETNAVVGVNEETGEPIRDYSVSVSNKLPRYIIISFLAGAVLSAFVALLIYTLDNKVKSASELEEITGASLLAVIEKEKIKV